jgi:hypothetical protein
MFDYLSGLAFDIVITLIIIFGANRVLWWFVGRRINISIKIVKRKPETEVKRYD